MPAPGCCLSAYRGGVLRWHEAAVREVERLGAALARQSGQEEEEAVRHLWGKLGMLLQRGNAAILANRVPSFPAPAIDGQH